MATEPRCEDCAPPNPFPKDVTPVPTPRAPFESADTVNLIVALLVRFPELSSLRSRPAVGQITLSYAIAGALSAEEQSGASASLVDHIRAFLDFGDEPLQRLSVRCEVDQTLSFVHVTRDVNSFSREELSLQVALLTERFAERLVKNETPDESIDDDPAARDELVEYAIDSMRDPAQQKSVVGFREEKRVLVYFLKAGKNGKARARS